MRRYRVTVNGHVYDVEVEEYSTSRLQGSLQADRIRLTRAGHSAVRVNSSVSGASQAGRRQARGMEPRSVAGLAPGKGTQVKAPLAGVILSVSVEVGSNVKRGDVLVSLEALKMENEIQSPVDGTVSYVGVSEGQDVQAGAVLVVIDNA